MKTRIARTLPAWAVGLTVLLVPVALLGPVELPAQPTPQSPATQSPAPGATWTLSDAVAAALASHPTATRAERTVSAARSGVAEARASRWPSAAIGGGITRFELPMVVAPLHAFDPANPPIFDNALVQSRLMLDHTLFDGGARSAEISGADAGFAAAVADQRMATSGLIARVADAYLALRSAGAVTEASARRTAALEAEVARADQMVAEGAAPRVVALRARAALSDARAEDAAARAQFEAARKALSHLTGVSAETLESVALLAVDLSNPEPYLFTAEPFPTRSNIPILVAARARADAASAGLRGSRSSLLPRLRLQTGVQQFGAVGEAFAAEWQGAVQVSFPVFTGGRRGAAIARAEANLDAARAAEQETELALEASLDADRARLTGAIARRAALRDALTQFEEIARIEALSLEEGVGVQRDFLTAEADLFRVRAAIAQADAAVVAAALSYARSTGELTPEWLTQNLEQTP